MGHSHYEPCFRLFIFDVGQTRYLTKHSLKTNKHCTFETAAKWWRKMLNRKPGKGGQSYFR